MYQWPWPPQNLDERVAHWAWRLRPDALLADYAAAMQRRRRQLAARQAMFRTIRRNVYGE
jgi:hypothetical protein